MYAIDPTMSFAQVVQYYKDYVKRTKSYGANRYPSCDSSQLELMQS